MSVKINGYSCVNVSPITPLLGHRWGDCVRDCAQNLLVPYSMCLIPQAIGLPMSQARFPIDVLK